MQEDLQELFFPFRDATKNQSASTQLQQQASPTPAAAPITDQIPAAAAVAVAKGREDTTEEGTNKATAAAAAGSLLADGQLPSAPQAAISSSSASELPRQYDVGPGSGAGPAPVALDDQQFLGQTCGWEVSWDVLQNTVREMGPFDGLLGFSQGASVAAVVAALQQQQQQQDQGHQSEPPQQGRHQCAHTGPCYSKEQQVVVPMQSAGAGEGSKKGVTSWHTSTECTVPLPGTQEEKEPTWLNEASVGTLSGIGFRFVVLCSGFVSPCAAHRQLLQDLAPVRLPSLHIFGSNEGGDRQIRHELSQELAALFDKEHKQLLIHPSGHYIPCSKDIICEIGRFLSKFTHQ
jgi:hypothetical protein